MLKTNIEILEGTPLNLGYRFPAEWERHEATWITFPWNEGSFPGKMETILPSYMNFIKTISLGEKVRINLNDNASLEKVKVLISKYEIQPEQVEFFIHPSDDVWCRDHGPSFVVNNKLDKNRKAIVDWEFNAWGGKYPYSNDNQIPSLVAQHMKYPIFKPGLVMEGGSIDVNGKGTLLTSESVLLNNNRNPQLSQSQIEKYLHEYYAIEKVLWLGEGIEGDDTDGHIDDLTRFVNADTVITMIEQSMSDRNYTNLKVNSNMLQKMRLANGKQINVVEIPMPRAVFHERTRLPASYANFYICNQAVVVPTYRCDQDDKALTILSSVFVDRPIVGIDSTDIVWGFGSFHCLSQQEPI